MNLRLMTKAILLGGLVALSLALSGCHSEPKTNIEKIDNLIKQVQADAVILNELNSKDFVTLEKDFRTCDSMLQYLSQEQVEKSFALIRFRISHWD